MTPDVAPATPIESVRRAVIHLRLMFSLVLTPLFVWGVYLALPRPVVWWQVVVAYLVVHVPLYGSMNAFNSYYDRDDGPIGSLEVPPPVDRSVLVIALICKVIALVAGFWLDPRYGLLIIVGLFFSLFYSHPRWRWKERPVIAALAIFAFQGVLGVLFGWTAATVPSLWSMASVASIWPPGVLNAVAVIGAACWTLGFYPLTGVYQIETDARSKVRTLAVALGVEGCFLFAAIVAPLGGLGVLSVLLMRGAYLAVVCCAIYVLGAAWYTWRWYQQFRAHTPLENQRVLMRLSYCNGLVFTILFMLVILSA